jgi:hypothetical protein
LKDLDKISAIDLGSPTLSQAIEEYNEEHLAIISTPDVLVEDKAGKFGCNG